MLTHTQWLYLLQRVLEIVQSGGSVSLHTLLSDIVAADDDQTIGTAMRCFLYRYNKNSIHSPRWFVHCSRFAIKILAHSLAMNAFAQRALMSEQVIREQCQKSLNLLITALDEFRPCEARYTGKGRSSKLGVQQHPIHCYQHKGAHEGGHRTCESVYGLTILKEILDWPSTDVWPGTFISSVGNDVCGGVSLEDEVTNLLCKVQELTVTFGQQAQAMYHEFISLFRDCRGDNLSEIFNRTCFCEKKPARFSNLVLRRQRPIISFIRIMQMRKVCATCYEELAQLWQQAEFNAVLPDAISTRQIVINQSRCVICYCDERDFLFLPCGHRGFCTKCADDLLDGTRICTICRKQITAKQRVYDV